jgi:taurine dioxygenase
MRVQRLSDKGGVAIEGPDLARPLSGAEEVDIGRLFDEHGLVVFRDQHLSKRQFHDAGRLFGGAMTAVPGTALDPDVPGIVIVSTRGATGDVVPEDGDRIVGDIEWHCDQAFTPRPPRARMLYAVEVPADGGLTGFIDGRSTYAALPEAIKRRIEGLHVIHSWRHAEATIARNRSYHREGDEALAADKFPDVAFPIAYAHPVTGVKVLNVPPLWAAGVVEMPGPEGDRLIADLKRHIVQPGFQYWHRYLPGDAVLWDNWRFIHSAGGTRGRHARTLWSIASITEFELGTLITGQGHAAEAISEGN